MVAEPRLPAPKLAFYADDFTGATDTLATVARAGLRALLFLRPPTDAQRQAAGPLDCLGIAGTSRSLRAEAQAQELGAAADYLATLRAPVTHYKTCSTFDSAPEIGSIGHAVGILRQRLNVSGFVPVIGGQPNLGRYCLFGHLFAAFQTGGVAYRLDRHPTMRQHPVTPMCESDLRLHLAAQGMRRMSAIAYPSYADAPDVLDALVDEAIAAGPDGVLFDVGQASHLPVLGRILWQRACREPLLAVGASSVAQALLCHWAGASAMPAAAEPSVASGSSGSSGPVLVLSGSMSPLTAAQIAAADAYLKIPLQVDALLGRDPAAQARAEQEIVSALRTGRDVLAYVCPPDDSAGRAAPPSLPQSAYSPAQAASDPALLARACGDLLARILEQVRPACVGVAGGDTSSHAVRALDVWGLSYVGQIDHGAALCRMHADAPHLSGLDIMLKGGQMGGEDIFERLRTLA